MDSIYLYLPIYLFESVDVAVVDGVVASNIVLIILPTRALTSSLSHGGVYLIKLNITVFHLLFITFSHFIPNSGYICMPFISSQPSSFIMHNKHKYLL